MLDRTTPPYHFSLSKEVLKRTPLEIEGVNVSALSFLPTRAREKDSGFDVRCAEPGGIELIPGRYFKMRLGFRMFAPDGWWLSLAPRSGTFIKRHIHALYGVIDETFEDEMCFVGQYIPDAGKILAANSNPVVKFGERIAQVLPAPRWEMPVVAVSEEEMDLKFKERNDPRGTGGFGSSGTV
jgi:dUTPase